MERRSKFGIWRLCKKSRFGNKCTLLDIEGLRSNKSSLTWDSEGAVRKVLANSDLLSCFMESPWASGTKIDSRFRVRSCWISLVKRLFSRRATDTLRHLMRVEVSMFILWSRTDNYGLCNLPRFRIFKPTPWLKTSSSSPWTPPTILRKPQTRSYSSSFRDHKTSSTTGSSQVPSNPCLSSRECFWSLTRDSKCKRFTAVCRKEKSLRWKKRNMTKENKTISKW